MFLLLAISGSLTGMFSRLNSISRGMWHVMNVAPNREAQVCEHLALHGGEAYAPQFPSAPGTRRGSVRDRRRRWVFPGYLFFKFPSGFDDWDAVRWAPGVRRVLDAEGTPALIGDGIVNHIRSRIARGQLTSPALGFRAGQAVVIKGGPLTSLDAVFDRELNSGDRVQVLVNLFHRQLPVHVARENLRTAG
jgi:transcription antitermination factor NusG